MTMGRDEFDDSVGEGLFASRVNRQSERVRREAVNLTSLLIKWYKCTFTTSRAATPRDRESSKRAASHLEGKEWTKKKLERRRGGGHVRKRLALDECCCPFAYLSLAPDTSKVFSTGFLLVANWYPLVKNLCFFTQVILIPHLLQDTSFLDFSSRISPSNFASEFISRAISCQSVGKECPTAAKPMRTWAATKCPLHVQMMPQVCQMFSTYGGKNSRCVSQHSRWFWKTHQKRKRSIQS